MTLEEFFRNNPAGALAFSGGTDSSFLVWAAKKFGQNWHAYYANTAFQPAFELADARKIAAECGLPLTIIEGDIFKYPEVIDNPENRCYLCKRIVFSMIQRQAKDDHYNLIIDGTNASDDTDARPGIQALREMGVRSPLRECGLTKSDVRELSRKAGLFTWNKPSYACLATRIPSNTQISQETLWKAELGESLLDSLGFTDFRLRIHGNAAILQVVHDQYASAFERREEILTALKAIFPVIAIDLLPRAKTE